MAPEGRPRPIRSVTIVAKRQAPEARGAARRCARFLEERGVTVRFDPATARALRRPRDARVLGGARGASDLCVVIGGDGTLLMAARALADRPRPILGVNLGGLGFLTETGPDEMERVLSDVLERRYTLEKRFALEVTVVRAGRVILKQRPLNDAVINKSALARILEIGLSIDREPVTVYRSDGLIISTPTGSTAYSLAAGGPIVHPRLGAFLVTPICPHTLGLRPLVVRDSSLAEITLRSGEAEVYL